MGKREKVLARKLQADLKKLEAKIDEPRGDIKKLEAKRNASQRGVDIWESAINKLKAQFTAAKEKYEISLSERDEQQFIRLEDNIEGYQSKLKEEQDKYDGFSEQIEAKQSLIKDEEAQIAHITQSLKRLKAQGLI